MTYPSIYDFRRQSRFMPDKLLAFYTIAYVFIGRIQTFPRYLDRPIRIHSSAKWTRLAPEGIGRRWLSDHHRNKTSIRVPFLLLAQNEQPK